MNVKPYILTVVNALLLCMGLLSCGSGEQEPFDAVERLLETDPAKADTLLSSIPEPGGRGRKAWYAVLKTQLDYKLYREIESDSLIKTATEYYGTPYKNVSRLRRYRAAMAWYSQGCVYYQNNDNEPAIQAFLKAKDLFPDTLNRYYLYAEQNLGKCYLNRMMIDKALEQFNLCAGNLLSHELTKAYGFVVYNIGLANLYSNNFQRADSIFESILQGQSYSYNQKVGALLHEAKIQFYGYHDCQQALAYVNEHIEKSKDEDRAAGYNLKGSILDELHQYDSAHYYYRKSYDNTDELYTLCSNAEKLSSLSTRLGHNDEALRWHDEYVLLRDSVSRRERSSDVEELLRKHQEELHKTELTFNKKRHTIIVVGLIAISVLISGLIYFIGKWRRVKSINKQESRLLFELQNTTLQLQELLSGINPNNCTDSQRILLLNLYKQRIDLCKQMFKKTDEYTLMMNILHELDDTKINHEYISSVINAVKHFFVECIYDIHREIVPIKDSEVIVLLLSALGCNNTEMGKLLYVSSDAVRKRKRKLMGNVNNDYLSLFFVKI